MNHQVNNLEGLQHQSQRFTGQESQMAQASGRFRGQTVVVAKNTGSLLQSAHEEASFFAAERLEKKFLNHRFDDNNPLGRLLSDGTHNLLDRFPNHREKAAKIISQILKENPQDLGGVLKHLRGIEHNPSLRALVLVNLIRQYGDGLAAGLLAGLKEELERLWQKHRVEINASINIADSIRKALKENSSFTSEGLQNLYIDSVLDYGGLAKTCHKLIEEYGEENLKSSLEFMLKALGDDLRSKDQSVEKAHLRMLISDMSKLKILLGVREQCHELCGKLEVSCGEPAGEDSTKILRVLLSLTEKTWSAADKMKELIGAMGLANIGAEIYFVRGFREILRRMPVKVFKDDYQRLQLLEAAQDILDEQIEQEEEGI